MWSTNLKQNRIGVYCSSQWSLLLPLLDPQPPLLGPPESGYNHGSACRTLYFYGRFCGTTEENYLLISTWTCSLPQMPGCACTSTKLLCVIFRDAYRCRTNDVRTATIPLKEVGLTNTNEQPVGRTIRERRTICGRCLGQFDGFNQLQLKTGMTVCTNSNFLNS